MTMDKYKDMLDIEYVKSSKRPHMSMYDRAAQFSPFAALTGYEKALDETKVLMEERVANEVEGEEFKEDWL